MFITLEDTQLFTVSFGSRTAPALLALSGWIGSWEDWADTLSLLSESWHTISYDHRGSGATLTPLETLTFDNLVADVFAVLEAYGIERCVLAAMSMGAAVALAAALQQPQRFSGLVLVNGAYYRETPLEQDPFFHGLNTNYAQTLDRFAAACVPEPNSDPIRRWGRQILERASPEAALRLYQMTGAIDLRGDLSRMTLPTLILHGDADPLVSVKSARWLAETLPNAKLVLVNGAGHVPIMTRQHEVTREIMDFFVRSRGV
jgi:pimeloyl-ACP methyl ester carboxylesterase